jgi:hypothetical protein
MNTDKPWWVKQRRFVVPSTLKARIQKLPEEIQKFYCFIVSKVIVITKKHPALYGPISSKYFKDFIGSDYGDYVGQLKKWHIIEVNDQYLNDPEHGFSKSYRLHSKARKASKVKLQFAKKQVQPLRDNSKLTDDVAEFVHRNLKRLGVRTDLLPQANVIDEVEAEDWAEAIHFNKFNLHYSESVKRLYHAVIVMPVIARKNLVLKENPSVPLYEYDVKSCHPVLLLALIEDHSERKKYTALLHGDIYGTIARECGIVADRASVKLDFLKFVNGSVANYFHKYFRAHLPVLTDHMMKHGSGMAWFGQTVEAGIMVDEVPRLLMDSIPVKKQSNLSLTCGGNPEVFYIPMHDGWLGVERDEVLIAERVRERFYEHTKYNVTLTKTCLATQEETVLPSVAHSQKKTPE